MSDILEILEHFKLKADPFGKVPGNEVFRGKRYMAALNVMTEWIRRGEMCALIGPPGSGKTTIMNDLARHCGERGDIHLVHCGHPGRKRMGPGCIFQAFAYEFAGQGLHFSQGSHIQFLELRAFLGDTMRGRHVGIVLDEAHRYPAEFIRGIKEFSEMQWGLRTDMLGIVFSGWPNFRTMIRKSAPDVYGRLRVGRKVIEAESIMRAEIGEYVRHRVRTAGNARVFEDGTLNALALVSGTPLKANAAAWDAMEIAFKDGSKTVRPEHVICGMAAAEKKRLLGDECTFRVISENTGISTSHVQRLMSGEKKNPEALGGIETFLDMAIEAGGVDNVKPPRRAASS